MLVFSETVAQYRSKNILKSTTLDDDGCRWFRRSTAARRHSAHAREQRNDRVDSLTCRSMFRLAVSHVYQQQTRLQTLNYLKRLHDAGSIVIALLSVTPCAPRATELFVLFRSFLNDVIVIVIVRCIDQDWRWRDHVGRCIGPVLRFAVSYSLTCVVSCCFLVLLSTCQYVRVCVHVGLCRAYDMRHDAFDRPSARAEFAAR